MKAHLLFADADGDLDVDLPENTDDLIADLELDTLLGTMAGGDAFLYRVSKRVLLASLDDPVAITYRQDVLRDCIAEPDVVRELYAVSVAAIEAKRSVWGFSTQSPSSTLSTARQRLEAFVELLRRQRKIADESAARFRSPGFTALFRSLQRELDDDYFHTVDHHLKQLRFRDGVLLSAALGQDNSGIDFVLREPDRSPATWKEHLGIGPRRSYSFSVPDRDEAGHNALADLTARGINLVANALAQSADHIFDYFTMLRWEIGFYIGCLNLRDRLEAKGEPTCLPTILDARPPDLSCTGLGDVCLALRVDDRVVGNDVSAVGTALVVITGANSGGKSTFLRSVGLAQLMMQCGLFVVAESFRASVCSGVFTHFIRNEDSTMRSGRLDEELSRMSSIADSIRPDGLMLFNESFAATNEREGSEIARQVVRALLDAQIRVFIVTHQFDLAHGLSRHGQDATLFLRAERLPDGRRPFRLVNAEPLSTSYGQDLYDKVFVRGVQSREVERARLSDAEPPGPLTEP